MLFDEIGLPARSDRIVARRSSRAAPVIKSSWLLDRPICIIWIQKASISIAGIQEAEHGAASRLLFSAASDAATMFQAEKRTWESLGVRARGTSSLRVAPPGACSRASARSNTAPMKR